MAFVVAARFRTLGRAQAIYWQVEQVLYQGEASDLSAYNIVLDGVPQLVVLGAQPSVTLQEQLTRLLATGESTELLADVVATLRRRREQEHGKGRWVEGHCRPGLRLRWNRPSQTENDSEITLVGLDDWGLFMRGLVRPPHGQTRALRTPWLRG